jgi:hypothetical protein
MKQVYGGKRCRSFSRLTRLNNSKAPYLLRMAPKHSVRVDADAYPERCLFPDVVPECVHEYGPFRRRPPWLESQIC